MSLRCTHRAVFNAEAATRMADPSLSVLILPCTWGVIDLGSNGHASVWLFPSRATAAVPVCHRHCRVSRVSRVRRVSGCTDVGRWREGRNPEHFDTQPGACRPAQPGSDGLWRRNGAIAARAPGRAVDAAGEGKHLRRDQPRALLAIARRYYISRFAAYG